MMKKLKTFIKKLVKSPSPNVKLALTSNYRMLMVEHALIESVLNSIDIAAKENLISSNEAKLLRNKYALILQGLNQTVDRCVAANDLRRLEKTKQRIQKEYETKMHLLEKEIRALQKNLWGLAGNQTNSSPRNILEDLSLNNPARVDRMKLLKDELLDAIERLEMMDRVT